MRKICDQIVRNFDKKSHYLKTKSMIFETSDICMRFSETKNLLGILLAYHDSTKNKYDFGE